MKEILHNKFGFKLHWTEVHVVGEAVIVLKTDDDYIYVCINNRINDSMIYFTI